MRKKLCKRCGKPFTPRRTPLKTRRWTQCCDVCGVRNLHDALGLPTPPELLDAYTKHPTLTKREYAEKLSKYDPNQSDS